MTYVFIKVKHIKRGEYVVKKYGKILVIMAIMIASGTVGTSCKKNTDGDVQILSQSSQKPETTDYEDKQIKEPEVSKEADFKQDKDYKEALANTTKLPIYCINDDTGEIETVEIFIDQKTELSSSFVVEKVVEEFSNHDLKIGIDKVEEDDKGNVVVSFKKNTAPESGVGEDVEYLILDCISQSILDDVDSSKAVIFQIEGDAYKSSHISYKLNEAYSWK